MFVNPVSNFSMSNAHRNNNQNNVKAQSSPVMQQSLNADTLSFGESDKKSNKSMRALPAAIAGALLSGAVYTSCSPDYESYTSLSQEAHMSMNNYHKCGCDSFPIIIGGGKDTVYIERPGETVHDTIIIEKPGETIHDTIYVDRPGGKDTIYVDRPVYDTIYVDRPVYDTIYVDRPVRDTIWIKPDTVYIPKTPNYEINDSINKDIKDFDIPTEGKGDFVYAFQGKNEYLAAHHLLIFNGFFSNEHKSSFVDHAFEEDDIPEGGDKPSKYYYTRYDISSDYVNGRRLVQVYVPSGSRHKLPDDKKTGEAGWDYVGKFYVKNTSVRGAAQMIANEMNGALKAKYTPNEVRGKGNIYKEWPLDDNQMPKTTIQNVKAYRRDLDDLKD